MTFRHVVWPPPNAKFYKERKALLYAWDKGDQTAFVGSVFALEAKLRGMGIAPPHRSSTGKTAEGARAYYERNREKIAQYHCERYLRLKAARLAREGIPPVSRGEGQ